MSFCESKEYNFLKNSRISRSKALKFVVQVRVYCGNIQMSNANFKHVNTNTNFAHNLKLVDGITQD